MTTGIWVRGLPLQWTSALPALPPPQSKQGSVPVKAGSAVGMSTGAFVDRTVRIAGAASGPLAGLSFAAKDLFNVELITP